MLLAQLSTSKAFNNRRFWTEYSSVYSQTKGHNGSRNLDSFALVIHRILQTAREIWQNSSQKTVSPNVDKHTNTIRTKM